MNFPGSGLHLLQPKQEGRWAVKVSGNWRITFVFREGQVFEVNYEDYQGYDITSLDLNSGELRLIEVKGIGGDSGMVLLTPNERRVAEDRRDCYWLYIVTNCKEEPKLQDPVKDPARLKWHEVKKVDHYYLSVDAVTRPMQIQEELEDFKGRKE